MNGLKFFIAIAMIGGIFSLSLLWFLFVMSDIFGKKFDWKSAIGALVLLWVVVGAYELVEKIRNGKT